VGRFGFGFGRRGFGGLADPRWTDRHALTEVMRVPLDQAAEVVDALAPHGIVASAQPPAEPDADATIAAIVVLAGEVDRAVYVLRRAGILADP